MNAEKPGVPAQVAGLEVYKEADGYVVYQSARDKVHFLNATAVFVLELCNGRHEIDEITSIFKEIFTDESDPEGAVNAILKEFAREDLIRLG